MCQILFEFQLEEYQKYIDEIEKNKLHLSKDTKRLLYMHGRHHHDRKYIVYDKVAAADQKASWNK